jgi:Predicted amidohydrolase
LHMPWNERHVFTPGNELNVFDMLGLKVGINVCYDAYFPEQTRALALAGAELIVSCFTGPTRSDPEGQIPSDRAAFLSRTRAMENGVYFAAVNRVGHQGGSRFIGNSAIAGPDGSLIASTESVEPCAVRAEIDRSGIASARFDLPLLKDRRVDLYSDLLKSWEVLAVPS